MKAPLRIYLCLSLLWFFTFVACEKVPDRAASSPASNVQRNPPPVANAGEDQVIYIPLLVTKLDASKSSDPSNDIRTYEWQQIGGRTVSAINIVDPNAKVVEVHFPVVGIYQFELKVTDFASSVSRDTVQVTVVDNFAPGVAPVFVETCDTVVLAHPQSSVYTWSGAAVIQGSETYYLYKGYTYTQLSGPTNSNVVHTNGAGSVEVEIQGLSKGTYVYRIEVDRNGLKAYDTSVIRVVDDTSSGKEYYFESTWVLTPNGDYGVMASTPSRPEVFFRRSGGMGKFRLWLKTHNSNDWVEVAVIDWMDALEYYFDTDRCGNSMIVNYWGNGYRDYAGKKVQMRILISK
jgi:PKD domain